MSDEFIVHSMRELRELATRKDGAVDHVSMLFCHLDGRRTPIRSLIPLIPQTFFLAEAFGGRAEAYAAANATKRRKMLRAEGVKESDIDLILDQ